MRDDGLARSTTERRVLEGPRFFVRRAQTSYSILRYNVESLVCYGRLDDASPSPGLHYPSQASGYRGRQRNVMEAAVGRFRIELPAVTAGIAVKTPLV